MFRIGLALVSTVVLVFTGYAYWTLRDLAGGLTSTDVIGSELSEPDGATDILLVGNDSRTDAQGDPLPEEVLRELRTTDEGGNLTDTMILVRIPNGGGRASAVSFPRDTMVRLTDGFGTHKLTEAYSRAQNDAREDLAAQGVSDERTLDRRSRAAGQRFLIENIERFAGVSIDHYAEVNLLGFYQITKAVGGVDVCLRAPVDDSEFSGAVFPAGPQRIEGADALSFVRQRHNLPRGDLDRVVRQQVFMSGLVRKMLSTGTLANPAKLASLSEAMQDAVILDKGWDLVSFAQQMQGIAARNVEFRTIPLQDNGDGTIDADPREVRRFVDDMLLSPEERQEQARSDPERVNVVVSVFNGSGVASLADRVSEEIAAEGFGAGTVEAVDSVSRTVVAHAPEEASTGALVSNALGGVPVEVDEEVAPGTVAVFLAPGYDGPGNQNFAGEGPMRLDGSASGQEQEAVGSPQNPITANGVPCVN
ncbi:LytR family transcriptional regulator [Allosaccharopolyspora coralli]|uniref:LytR family transcriptional regulator n=1 Tax=Allosaccharopolyspora coralli TaxID=2665642 RepID=A0A5Q3Q2P5_9PSEU|nr:LCP family protein [Allosaccharopolyspora coralli]QGK68742.1 LytR family transcriptional regulator [Allosaccharopolyspora coralli]